MKRILITGADSYIGTSFEKWLAQPQFAEMYEVNTLDMRGEEWKAKDFSGYDSVFHVAGIAHADVGKVTEEQKKLYYLVNCDLAVETAKKAKESGVKQFIYMSSIIVYGEGTSLREKKVITRETIPSPSNFYGDSKWRAEKKLEPLGDKRFKVAILRPPMIYGKNSKGNYGVLSRIAQRLPLFPDIKNERSVLFIGNLCEFVRILIESCREGIYFPQNKEYVKTSDFVKHITAVHNRKVWITPVLNIGVYFLSLIPGKSRQLIHKAFGSLVYSKAMDTESSNGYQKYSLEKSIILCEAKGNRK